MTDQAKVTRINREFRQLPQALDEEHGILSACLNDPEIVSQVSEMLKPVDFYRTAHQIIFRAITTLSDAGRMADHLSTATQLMDDGKLKQVGGAAYISQLSNFPVAINLKFICDAIKRAAAMRDLIKTMNQAMDRAYDEKDPAKLLMETRQALEKVAESCLASPCQENRVPDKELLAITANDWDRARLSPRCIVSDYIYADVGVLSAPGGTGKTTTNLYEAIHIVLGRPLYGLKVVSPGWVLFITAEDSKEVLIARLREVASGMGLNNDEIAIVMQEVLFWDVSGSTAKLIEMQDGNVVLTEMPDKIIGTHKKAPPAIVIFDPAVSFGVGESKVNDNEQGLIMACRRIRNGLDCAVRLIAHTGQAAAREKSLDQYTSRGGTALPDGSRMAVVLQPWLPNESKLRPPQGCNYDSDSSIIILARPKLSFAKPNLPRIWIKRTGWKFEYHTEITISEDERERAILDQVVTFVQSAVRRGERINRTGFDAHYKEMGLTRQQLRDARDILLAKGRLIIEPLPKEEQRNNRKDYITTPKQALPKVKSPTAELPEDKGGSYAN
jgi:RecA-family ATPase